MKYAFEAYELLIEKLKTERSELADKLDEECGTNSVIICGLLEFIVKNLNYEAAIKIAEFYDEQYPDEQLVQYLVDEFGGKND